MRISPSNDDKTTQKFEAEQEGKPRQVVIVARKLLS